MHAIKKPIRTINPRNPLRQKIINKVDCSYIKNYLKKKYIFSLTVLLQV